MSTMRRMLGLVFVLAASWTHGTTFSVVYTGDNTVDTDGTIIAQAGDVLTFDVILDFAPRVTVGGSFNITWDASAFALQGFDFSQFGDPALNRPPEVTEDGLLDTFIGDFGGFDVANIGSMSFVFAPPEGAGTNDIFSIAPTATTGPAGGWIDAFIGPPIEPEYIGVNVRVVPIPAALWLMVGGVLALPAVARRRTA
ncbi:MAG: VPLPA-CTERM sorting domain-containing protein [Pseudomonadota bacterium]